MAFSLALGYGEGLVGMIKVSEVIDGWSNLLFNWEN
jgi:hypothetical protein